MKILNVLLFKLLQVQQPYFQLFERFNITNCSSIHNLDFQEAFKIQKHPNSLDRLIKYFEIHTSLVAILVSHTHFCIHAFLPHSEILNQLGAAFSLAFYGHTIHNNSFAVSSHFAFSHKLHSLLPSSYSHVLMFF